jgi:cell wall-associated NlpC family hydrolase
MSHWSSKYIGIPYVVGGRDKSGLDCWGLLRLVYADEFGIQLPVFAHLNVESAMEACSAVATESVDWEEISKPIDGCGVAMSQRKAIHHVGLYANSDGGKIIHSWERHNVICDTLRGLWLKGFKIVKFYKHHGLHS